IPFNFVNLPPMGDEALTNCLPWFGPPETPAPWGGQNANPPQVWQTWSLVQSMIASAWKNGSQPYSITIYLADPQGSLDDFKNCAFGICFPNTWIEWLIEDDPTVPMDQSLIVFNNQAISEGEISAWRSDTCYGTGALDVTAGQTGSMIINVPDGHAPFN